MTTFAIQTKTTVTVTEDGAVKDTVTNQYSLTVTAKERKDVVIPNGGAWIAIDLNIAATDYVFIKSDQIANARFTATGTSVPIPANGHVVIMAAVPSATGLEIQVPGATDGNVLIIVGDKA